MAEKIIPWWRKALEFALGGLRSGFGLFSRPARPEPVPEQMISSSIQESPEEDRALIESSPNTEIAADTQPVPAKPEPDAMPANAPESMQVPEPTQISAVAKGETDLIDTIPAESESKPDESAGTEQTASEPPEEQTSGAKAHVDSTASAAVMAKAMTYQSCPDASCDSVGIFPQAVKSRPDTTPAFSAASEAEAEPETEAVSLLATEAEVESELMPIVEAEPVAEAEEVNEAEAEPVVAAEAVDTPEAAVEAIEEPVEASESEPEADPEVEPEPVIEAVPEPEPMASPAPTADADPPLVLKPQPSAEERAEEKANERAAAKLAARQKRLDEGSEESPFSVIVGQVYDGPLDLLLDLIRKQDIDIYDIPIAIITSQFLAYVNQLKASDVDVAGDFIYTASLLIHIKSKMLLPHADTGPEAAAEDPRRELVERLLEHERFKNAAQMLLEKQMLEAATWSNPGAREFKDDEAAEPEIAADTVDLVRIFREILERARNRPVINVEEDSVTVGQMIQFLARRLTMEDKPVALRRLLSHTRSERALIAMFLALLEMVRLQAILLRQDRQFSEIFIKKHNNFDTVMNEGLGNARDDWR
jgi:segregation and condensation protein A